MFQTALVVFGAIAAFTLTASYAMYRSSNRSALWNVIVGSLAVLVLAIALLVTAVILTRVAFRGLR